MEHGDPPLKPRSRFLRSTAVFALTLLLIEFLDELVCGVTGAAWPLIRTDLGLNYAQIGLLLGVPSLVSSIVEPFLGILGDVWRRRILILGGGVVFTLALSGAAMLGLGWREPFVLLTSFPPRLIIFSPRTYKAVSSDLQ